MKIARSWFKTEIEITTEELRYLQFTGHELKLLDYLLGRKHRYFKFPTRKREGTK